MVFCVHKYCLYLRQLGCAASVIQQSVLLGTLIFVRLFLNCNFWVWYVKKWERNWLDRPDQRVWDCLSVRALSRVLHDMRLIFSHPRWVWGFPGGPAGKESACNATDPGSIPGSGRSLGEGNGYPLQYSGLGIPWTEETAVYLGLQRVGHDWATNTTTMMTSAIFVH